MKKSKLIVPAALAVMLLSTAASVSGTVAWFTANRAVEINASKFEVTTTDGNLAVSATAVANADIGADGKTITIHDYDQELGTPSGTPDYAKLTDASVNLQRGDSTVVYDNGDVFDEHNYPTSYIEVASTYATDTEHVVLCVAWNLTFTFEFTASADNGSKVSLFFNVEDSSMSEANSATIRTGKGFRIGMSTASNAIVFADQELQKNCNYVVSTSAMAEPNVYTGTVNAPSYYASGENQGKVETEANYSTPYVLCNATSLNGATKAMLVDSSVGYTGTSNASHTNAFAKATNGTLEDHQKRGDYLGSFTKSATPADQQLVVKCFAWYEGTDPYIVNAETLNEMASSLHFYTRTSSVA